MVYTTIAKIYAEAVFLISSQFSAYEEFKKAFEDIKIVFYSSPDLKKIFISPVVPNKIKHGIIDEVFSFVPKGILNLMHILINKHREKILDAISEEYLKILDAREKVTNVELYSAQALNNEQKNKLSDMLSQLLKSNIKIEEKICPELIGGIVIKTEDRVIDGSLKNYIEKFKEKIIS